MATFSSYLHWLATCRHKVLMAVGRCALALLAATAAMPQKAVAPQRDFDQIAAQAERARDANDLDEAVILYRQALSLRPQWAEGWWYLGTLLYDRDVYEEAALAFKNAATLNPKVGSSLVMLGLCEIKLGRNGEALKHIQQGRELGDPADPQLRHVMLYQEGLLLLNESDFWTAQAKLESLCREGVDCEDLTIALGFTVLRIRPVSLPSQYPTTREIARRAGWAEHFAAQEKSDQAMREYDRLATDFPRVHNVQYAYGRYLVVSRHPARAIEAFEREIENSPNHVLARLEIAAIDSKTNPSAGLPYAEEALRLDPQNSLGHYFLGLLLLNTEQPERAIPELKTAARSLPNEARVHYALGNAYARTHRMEDARRERAIFQELDGKAKGAAGHGGGDRNSKAAPQNPPELAKPSQARGIK
jgi:tetratricopeptide (TPR) repeat protein